MTIWVLSQSLQFCAQYGVGSNFARISYDPSLSYRGMEELMTEQGVNINLSTVQRRIIKYTGMLEETF